MFFFCEIDDFGGHIPGPGIASGQAMVNHGPKVGCPQADKQRSNTATIGCRWHRWLITWGMVNPGLWWILFDWQLVNYSWQCWLRDMHGWCYHGWVSSLHGHGFFRYSFNIDPSSPKVSSMNRISRTQRLVCMLMFSSQCSQFIQTKIKHCSQGAANHKMWFNWGSLKSEEFHPKSELWSGAPPFLPTASNKCVKPLINGMIFQTSLDLVSTWHSNGLGNTNDCPSSWNLGW